jgi:hypothetical protein
MTANASEFAEQARDAKLAYSSEYGTSEGFIDHYIEHTLRPNAVRAISRHLAEHPLFKQRVAEVQSSLTTELELYESREKEYQGLKTFYQARLAEIEEQQYPLLFGLSQSAPNLQLAETVVDLQDAIPVAIDALRLANVRGELFEDDGESFKDTRLEKLHAEVVAVIESNIQAKLFRPMYQVAVGETDTHFNLPPHYDQGKDGDEGLIAIIESDRGSELLLCRELLQFLTVARTAAVTDNLNARIYTHLVDSESGDITVRDIRKREDDILYLEASSDLPYALEEAFERGDVPRIAIDWPERLMQMAGEIDMHLQNYTLPTRKSKSQREGEDSVLDLNGTVERAGKMVGIIKAKISDEVKELIMLQLAADLAS